MVFGIISDPKHLDLDKLFEILAEEKKDFNLAGVVKKGLQATKGKEKIKNE